MQCALRTWHRARALTANGNCCTRRTAREERQRELQEKHKQQTATAVHGKLQEQNRKTARKAQTEFFVGAVRLQFSFLIPAVFRVLRSSPLLFAVAFLPRFSQSFSRAVLRVLQFAVLTARPYFGLSRCTTGVVFDTLRGDRYRLASSHTSLEPCPHHVVIF